ncbi:hypothetical protein [Massilia sp. S19_KUP03_FR1]|uniref:hypothetical protein n=1 Tax=Massilia sp. S19_KUP03_FR1 TaxID=3025503 RepID=UPI002FCDBEEC
MNFTLCPLNASLIKTAMPLWCASRLAPDCAAAKWHGDAHAARIVPRPDCLFEAWNGIVKEIRGWNKTGELRDFSPIFIAQAGALPRVAA